MARDVRKLRAFQAADDLVVAVYQATARFPAEERFGLTAQIRRAAVSVPANLVEGPARRSAREYGHFVNIALGSASELHYLLDLAARLGYLDPAAHESLATRLAPILPALTKLAKAMGDATQSPEPKAQSQP